MSGRESLAQTFTLLSFVSAVLIGLVHLVDDGTSSRGATRQARDSVIPLNGTPSIGIDSDETISNRAVSSRPNTSSRAENRTDLALQNTRSSADVELASFISSVPDNQTTDGRNNNQQRTSDRPLAKVLAQHTDLPVDTDHPIGADSASSSAPSRQSAFLTTSFPSLHQSDQVERAISDQPTTPDLTSDAEQMFVLMAHPGFSAVQPALSGLSRRAIAPSPSESNAQLIVDLSDRQVVVRRNGVSDVAFPIAIGRAGWETPIGEFTIIHKQENPVWENPITNQVIGAGPDNPLGTHWIGFWSDGKNQLGFHGTNQTDLIGQAVSHGCIRMRNEHIQHIYEQVSLGTPVRIQP